MEEVEGERKVIIMRKEFVICLIIIALIAIGNFFSRDYTKKSGEEILDSLQQIKQAVEAKEDDVKSTLKNSAPSSSILEKSVSLKSIPPFVLLTSLLNSSTSVETKLINSSFDNIFYALSNISS